MTTIYTYIYYIIYYNAGYHPGGDTLLFPATRRPLPPPRNRHLDPFEPPLGHDEEQVTVGANSWARAVFTGTVAHITRTYMLQQNIILLYYMVVTKKGLLPRRRGWRPLAGNLFCIILYYYYCTLGVQQINGADKTVRTRVGWRRVATAYGGRVWGGHGINGHINNIIVFSSIVSFHRRTA